MTVTEVGFESWASEIKGLLAERDAVLLAHNYQHPWIQDVADHVADSLELSRIAARSDASTLVFCGVHFMAETAKILAPDKRVLIPDPGAGCSLAASITAEQLRDWKAEHPDAIVVMYVNTTADVKAESDYCCTSANAPDVVRAIPADKEILFGPDMFLGAHVERETGRKLHIWMGECHVHAGIEPSDIKERLENHPEAEIHIHPECGCASQALYMRSMGELPEDRTFILGTGGMLERARTSDRTEFIIATETRMLHRLRTEVPDADFVAANPSADCRFMAMITPTGLLDCLRWDRHEVALPRELIERAKVPLERMIALG